MVLLDLQHGLEPDDHSYYDQLDGTGAMTLPSCDTDPCDTCKRRNAVLASSEWAAACDAAELIGFDIKQVEIDSDTALEGLKDGVHHALRDARQAIEALTALLTRIDTAEP
jgi:hypothetical protein